MSGSEEVKDWFESHDLPWNANIVGKLDTFGIEKVEDLKLYTEEKVADLFVDENEIAKRNAEIAWRELGGKESFQFSRKPSTIPPPAFTTPSPTSRAGHTSCGNGHRMHKNRSGGDLLNKFGFTKVVSEKKTKMKEDGKRRVEDKQKGVTGTMVNVAVIKSPCM